MRRRDVPATQGQRQRKLGKTSTTSSEVLQEQARLQRIGSKQRQRTDVLEVSMTGRRRYRQTSPAAEGEPERTETARATSTCHEVEMYSNREHF